MRKFAQFGTGVSLLGLLLISFEDTRTRPAAAQEVGQRFQDCAACPVMVVIPAGSFMMGSPGPEADSDEGPQHRVTIEAPFAVGIHEVTFAEWDACVDGAGCGAHFLRDNAPRESDRHPVVPVSWDEAWAYTAWLSRETGELYRLLSEAEWEYMARAGTQTDRYWGDDPYPQQFSYQCRYANGRDQTAHAELEHLTEPVPCSDWYVRTAPVGSFRSNAFGLHDVLGNVSEWTEDCWNNDYSSAPADGSARRLGDCSRRVMRGGSWWGQPWSLRSAFRAGVLSEVQEDVLGFRVARTLKMN